MSPSPLHLYPHILRTQGANASPWFLGLYRNVPSSPACSMSADLLLDKKPPASHGQVVAQALGFFPLLIDQSGAQREMAGWKIGKGLFCPPCPFTHTARTSITEKSVDLLL